MLVSLGKNEFIDINQVVAIFNFEAIEFENRKPSKKALGLSKIRSVILTRDNKLLGSTFSAEVLASRSYRKIFSKVFFSRESKKLCRRKKLHG
ncbi:hypothetical protein HYY75_06160 [bacterium]|nr:hypothetical protein [bacterium]